jgi:homopolymeric O-antigen transport system ATP-binding protein
MATPSEAGRKYISKVWIPGNFLAEGMTYVNANCTTLNPDSQVFGVQPAIAFTVSDAFEEDTARGDFAKKLGGIVRPLLKWTTEYLPNGHIRKTSAILTEAAGER